MFVSLSLSLSLALYQQNQVDVVRICGPIYGISGVYSPYLWPYIIRICGHVLPIFFVLVSIFGYILGIYGQGGTPVFIFFIDARDGTAGGRVGGRMSRASMKRKMASIHSGLDFSTIYGPYMNHIFPEHARLFPALASFVAVLIQNGPI